MRATIAVILKLQMVNINTQLTHMKQSNTCLKELINLKESFDRYEWKKRSLFLGKPISIPTPILSVRNSEMFRRTDIVYLQTLLTLSEPEPGAKPGVNPILNPD